MAATLFKRLILRAVLRDVNPMVIRLTAVPDSLDLADFDSIFHTVLGWDSGIGYAFQVHGQEFNSFRRRRPRSSKTFDFIAKRSFFTRSARWTNGSGNFVWSICKTARSCNMWEEGSRKATPPTARRPSLLPAS